MTGVGSLLSALSNRFEVLRELGRGGMATVYLARDLKLGREVALKVLHPELSAAIDLERFAREIRISATLQHPRILPLFDSGQVGELVYFVMPFVAGESLRDRIRRESQLPVPEAIRIARHIAEALNYAHERQIVHRDIKPENILLSGENVFVADFGVARAIGSAELGPTTSSGIAVGTPYYMSPEQASAATQLDGRSDIYSLGCVFYEMLAGEPPFVGPSVAAIIARHVQAEVPSIKIVRPNVSEELQGIIETAMNKVPADRFQTAGEFIKALDSATQSGVSPGTLGATGRGRVQVRTRSGARNQLLRRAGLALGVVAVLLTGWFGRRLWMPAAEMDRNLILVAPFGVQDRALEADWHDGLATLLSRNLDGAGVLRAVDPAGYLRTWSDKSSPQDVAKSHGAGLSVSGTVTRAGSDSIHVRASVYDVSSGQSLPDVEVYGPAARMDRISDSLSIALLRVLAPTRIMGNVQLASLRASVPAIKAFLRGERWSRQATYDSAAYYFHRATELDPAFALAYQRLYFINVHSGGVPDTLTYEYALRAGQLNRGLAPRESVLVAIDSLYAALSLGRFADDSTQGVLRTRFIAALDAAVNRFRSDPEVWFRLGDALYANADPAVDAPPARTLKALDQAIALDSTFAPAYMYAIELAMRVNGQADAMRHINAYLRLNPQGVDAEGMRLASRWLGTKGPSEKEIASSLKGVPAVVAFSAFQPVFWWPDSMETSVRLARHIYEDPKGGAELASSSWPQRLLFNTLGWRGRLAEAFAIRPDSSVPTTLLPLLSGSEPIAPQVSAAAVPLLSAPLWPPNALAEVIPFWGARGDTSALNVVMRRADSLARASSNSKTRSFARYLTNAASIHLALVKHDSSTALARLMALADTVCAVCEYERVIRARLLRARGRNEEARAQLSRALVAENLPVGVVWRLERARSAAVAGDRDTSQREYQFVADLWRNADASLQPIVREARAYLDSGAKR